MLAPRRVQRSEGTDKPKCGTPTTDASVLTQVAAGFNYLGEKRKEVIRAVGTQAGGKEDPDFAEALVRNLLSSLATAVSGGLSKLVGSALNDVGARFIATQAFDAVATSSRSIAERGIEGLVGEKDADKRRELFFNAAQGTVTEDVFESITAANQAVFEHGTATICAGPGSIAKTIYDQAGAAVALQHNETWRAWMTFQAQSKFGATPNHGRAPHNDAPSTANDVATRVGVGIAPTKDAKGVLQVALNNENLFEIVRARLPGNGTIAVTELLRTTPIGQLRIPVRFAVDGLASGYGVFVNEAGIAVAQGAQLELWLYRLSGGAELAEGEKLGPKHRPFVDMGLEILKQRLLAQKLGKKVEL